MSIRKVRGDQDRQGEDLEENWKVLAALMESLSVLGQYMGAQAEVISETLKQADNMPMIKKSIPLLN